MPKFTFICEHEADQFSGARESRLTFDADFLDDVVQEFSEFLRGAGYYFQGDVQVVDVEAIEREQEAKKEASKWNPQPLEEAFHRMAQAKREQAGIPETIGSEWR